MSELLKALYYGELDFSSKLLENDEEGRRLKKEFDESLSALTKALPEDSDNIFAAYEKAESELEDKNREMAFQRGFKLAVHLILEGNQFT